VELEGSDAITTQKKLIYLIFHPGFESKEAAMAICEQCGNDYDKSFEVSMAGRTMIFDSFE
jgi:hypothetical protein